MLYPGEYLQDKRYFIIRNLDEGGMGRIYEAMDNSLNCVIAIKETFAKSERDRKQFRFEAQLLANLRHPVLPKVMHHFIEGEGQYLVMEYIHGSDLYGELARELRVRKRPLGHLEVIQWADSLLGALEFLHSRKPRPVIHRDIKPKNIKLTTEGEIYLLDFGLAKGSTGEMSAHDSSIVHGYTEAYAPLEQLTNTGTNPQSDLYSLGATLYHLLTGKVPTKSSKRYEQTARGRPDPLPLAHDLDPGIPQELSHFLADAMAINWWDRTESAIVMRQALRKIAAVIDEATINLPPTIHPGEAEVPRSPQRTPQRPTAPSPTAGSPLHAAIGQVEEPGLVRFSDLSTLNIPPPTVPSPTDVFSSSSTDSVWPSHITSETKDEKPGAEVARQKVEEIFAGARAAFDGEDWDTAIEQLELLISLDPAHEEAKTLLGRAQHERQCSRVYAEGRAHYDVGRWLEAIAAFREFSELEKDYKDTSSLIENAKTQMKLEEAQALFEDARAAIEHEEWAKATEMLEATLESNPAHAEAKAALTLSRHQQELASLYLTATGLFNAGRWADAISRLSQMLQIDSNYRDVATLIEESRKRLTEERITNLDRLAAKAIAGEDWTSAIKHLEEILTIELNDASASASLSEAAIKLKQVPELRRNSDHYRLAIDHYQLGHWKAALSELEQVERNYRDTAALMRAIESRLNGKTPASSAEVVKPSLERFQKRPVYYLLILLGVLGVAVIVIRSVVLWYRHEESSVVPIVQGGNTTGAGDNVQPATSPTSAETGQIADAEIKFETLDPIKTNFEIYEAALNSDGRMVAVIGATKNIEIWQVEDRKQISSFPSDIGRWGSIVFSSTDNRIVWGSYEGKIRTGSVTQGAPIQSIGENPGYIFNLLFSNDGQALVSASHDVPAGKSSGSKLIQVRRVEDWSLLSSIPIKPSETVVAISPEKNLIAVSTTGDQRVELRSLKDGSLVKKLAAEQHQEDTTNGAFSRDGNILALGKKNVGVINLWKVDGGTLMDVQLESDEPKPDIDVIAFSPDGRIIAAGRNSGSIQLWRMSDGRLLKSAEMHVTGRVRSLSFSASGHVLAATGKDDRQIRLWRVSN